MPWLALERVKDQAFHFRIQVLGFHLESVYENGSDPHSQEDTIPTEARTMVRWTEVF